VALPLDDLGVAGGDAVPAQPDAGVGRAAEGDFLLSEQHRWLSFRRIGDDQVMVRLKVFVGDRGSGFHRWRRRWCGRGSRLRSRADRALGLLLAEGDFQHLPRGFQIHVVEDAPGAAQNQLVARTKRPIRLDGRRVQVDWLVRRQVADGERAGCGVNQRLERGQHRVLDPNAGLVAGTQDVVALPEREFVGLAAGQAQFQKRHGCCLTACGRIASR